MKIKRILGILVIAMLFLGLVMATVQASDAASKKVKVTWKANGGKIGTKTTTTSMVKKNAKVGTLKTAKNTGYKFMGWYTKSKGGIKITKSTKIKKKITFYAHWKRSLTTKEKTLVGKYAAGDFSSGFWAAKGNDIKNFVKGSTFAEIFVFKLDGTYVNSYYYNDSLGAVSFYRTGKWAVTTDGKLRLTNVVENRTDFVKPSNSESNRPLQNEVRVYTLSTIDKKPVLTFNTDTTYYIKS